MLAVFNFYYKLLMQCLWLALIIFFATWIKKTILGLVNFTLLFIWCLSTSVLPNYGWYAELLLWISLQFLLGIAGVRLNLKIMLKSWHICPGVCGPLEVPRDPPDLQTDPFTPKLNFFSLIWIEKKISRLIMCLLISNIKT